MKKLFLLLAFPMVAMAVSTPVRYVQVDPPTTQQGGPNTQTATVTTSLKATYMGTQTQCVRSVNGVLSGTGQDCGIATVIGGSNTIVASPQFRIPFYSATGSSNVLTGASGFSWYGSSAQVTGVLVSSGALNINSVNGVGGPINFLGPDNNPLSGTVGIGLDPFGSTAFYIASAAGVGININDNRHIADLIVRRGGNGSAAYSTFALTDNGGGTGHYSGFSSTSGITTDTIWSLPVRDGTTAQALLTNGTGNFYFGSVSGILPLVSSGIAFGSPTNTVTQDTNSLTFANRALTISNASASQLILNQTTIGVVQEGINFQELGTSEGNYHQRNYSGFCSDLTTSCLITPQTFDAGSGDLFFMNRDGRFDAMPTGSRFNAYSSVIGGSLIVGGTSGQRYTDIQNIGDGNLFVNHGVITSTMTVSTVTVSGQIVLADGTHFSSTSTFAGGTSSTNGTITAAPQYSLGTYTGSGSTTTIGQVSGITTDATGSLTASSATINGTFKITSSSVPTSRFGAIENPLAWITLQSAIGNYPGAQTSGLYVDVLDTAPITNPLNDLIAIHGIARQFSTSNSQLIGGWFEAYGQGPGSPNIAAIYAVPAWASDLATGTTSTMIGINITPRVTSLDGLTNKSTGTVIGLQIPDYTSGHGAAGQNWAFYIPNPYPSYFNGTIGLGQTDPQAKLSIAVPQTSAYALIIGTNPAGSSATMGTGQYNFTVSSGGYFTADGASIGKGATANAYVNISTNVSNSNGLIALRTGSGNFVDMTMGRAFNDYSFGVANGANFFTDAVGGDVIHRVETSTASFRIGFGSGLSTFNMNTSSMNYAGNAFISGGVTTSSIAITGSGNPSFNNQVDASTYAIVGTSVSATIVVGHLATWSTGYGLIDGGVVPSGGGTPGGSNGRLQFNSTGTFAGVPGTVVTASSITLPITMIRSSVTIDNGSAVQDNSSPGFLDVFQQAPVTSGILMSVGSSNQANQFVIQDQQPIKFQTNGIQAGFLNIGQSASEKITAGALSANQYINFDNSGEMDIQTASVGSGGKDIVMLPYQVEEFRVSSSSNISAVPLVISAAQGGVYISNGQTGANSASGINLQTTPVSGASFAGGLLGYNLSWNVNASSYIVSNDFGTDYFGMMVRRGGDVAFTGSNTTPSNTFLTDAQVMANNKLYIKGTTGLLGVNMGATVPSVAGFQVQGSTTVVDLAYISTTTVSGFGVDISTTGHFNIFNTAVNQGPTITNGTGDASCSDVACTITASNSPVTFTFAKPYTKVPVCVVTEQTDSLVNALSYSKTATALTITQTGLSGALLDVICVGRD